MNTPDMALVASALKAVGERALEMGVSDYPRPHIVFYEDGQWTAFLWRTGYKAVAAHGTDPLAAIFELNRTLEEYDPALNWRTLGVEVAA